MEFDNMDHMPEWEHFSHFEQKESEFPETLPKKVSLAKNLYNQARIVYKYSALFCETLEGEMAQITANLIMQNVMMLCPKIVGAEGANIYIVRMENASIIRTNCKELETQVKAAEMFEICKPDYLEIVLDELDKFKLLFIKWVKSFEKDEFEDDWGLY
ncbi:hypothetical protein [Pedobacter aquatilis]|uniref:hypothetical protein n=1 Tax=Pedobacter aquatilis TaxID=351343 RepID=UPI00292EAF21|nr:hypothetical protein [Pedobacter aquatilis]